MPDDTQIDPLLARMLQSGPFNPRRPPTSGAGLVSNPSLMRALSLNRPQPMPGFSPATPGAGFMPNKGNPNLTFSEQQRQNDILPPSATHNLKNTVGDYSSFALKSGPFITPGTNNDFKDAFTNTMKATTGNDPRNILADKLEGIRRAKADKEAQYNMALTKQQLGSAGPMQPPDPQQNLAPVLSMDKRFMVRQPHSDELAQKVAEKLSKTNGRDAFTARNYTNYHNQVRDAIQDYDLARKDMSGWVDKNAVTDSLTARENLRDLNNALRNQGHPTMDYGEYKQMLRDQLHENIQRVGPEGFYGALGENIKKLQGQFEDAHRIISNNMDKE